MRQNNTPAYWHWLAPLVLLLGSANVSATCARPSAFVVDSLTVEKSSVYDAFSALVGKAGFRVTSLATSGEVITAKDMGGPLESLLDQLAEKTNTAVRTDLRNCVVTVYDAGKAPAEKFYNLKEGEPIHQELQKWATAEGWKLFWQMPHSWRVFSDASYKKDTAVAAISEVILNLRDEGKAVRMTVFESNHVLEVVSSELSN